MSFLYLSVPIGTHFQQIVGEFDLGNRSNITKHHQNGKKEEKKKEKRKKKKRNRWCPVGTINNFPGVCDIQTKHFENLLPHWKNNREKNNKVFNFRIIFKVFFFFSSYKNLHLNSGILKLPGTKNKEKQNQKRQKTTKKRKKSLSPLAYQTTILRYFCLFFSFCFPQDSKNPSFVLEQGGNF